MPDQTTTYFWIITASYRRGAEVHVNTISGTSDIPAGYTRSDMYQEIRTAAARQLGRDDFTVQYFHLEPDQL